MRDTDLVHWAAALSGEPWAILPAKLRALVDVLERRLAGDGPDPATLEQPRAEQRSRLALAGPGGSVREVRGMPVRQVGRVAVLPLLGTITQRPGLFSRYSGGTSAEQFAAAHEELVADPAVSAVVWDVDSPGGSVAGVPKAADRLFALRGRKPTAAVPNSMMASAAYWLGSAADEVVVSPSSLTGSIGVYVTHEDQSGADAKDGYAVTLISAGRYKTDGHPHGPLSDTARGSLPRMVDDYCGQFVAAVARHRRATAAAVRAGYGVGDVLTANRAVGAWLADRVGTLAETVRRMESRAGEGGVTSAERLNPALVAAIQRQQRAERL